MYNEYEEEEATQSVQRVWRGFLGRKKAAKTQLNREREKIRSKHNRKQNNINRDSKPSIIQPQKHDDGDCADENVVVYTAIKRAGKLGTFDKRGSSHLSSTDKSSNSHSFENPDNVASSSTANSHQTSKYQTPIPVLKPTYVEDPLLSSHLSAIAEEDEILRDSLTSTATHGIISKPVQNAFKSPILSADNSPKTQRKSAERISPAAVNGSYIADSLEEGGLRQQLRLHKQQTSRTNSNRSGMDYSDVDTEAEDVVTTGRGGGSSEADSIEYGQFIKTDRFDDFVAGLNDNNEEENAWDDVNFNDAEDEKLSHHNKNSNNNLQQHVQIDSNISHNKINHTNKSRLDDSENIHYHTDNNENNNSTGIPRFTSRKGTMHLQAFASDGSLSQRMDSYGEPNCDLQASSSNRIQQPQPQQSQSYKPQDIPKSSYKSQCLSPEKPFIPSVKDLLAVSPTTSSSHKKFRRHQDQGTNYMNILDHNNNEEDEIQFYIETPRINIEQKLQKDEEIVHTAARSKLEEAQFTYENNVKKNFPVLKPQQPGMLIQPSRHSRNNSNASSSNSNNSYDYNATPPLSSRSNMGGNLEQSPRSLRNNYAPNPANNYANMPNNMLQHEEATVHSQGIGQLQLHHPHGLYDQQGPGTPKTIRLQQQQQQQQQMHSPLSRQTPPLFPYAVHSQQPHQQQQQQELSSIPIPNGMRHAPPPRQLQQQQQYAEAHSPSIRHPASGGGYAAEYQANQQSRAAPPVKSVLGPPPGAVAGQGKFSSLPSKLIPPSLSKAVQPSLAAVKPTATGGGSSNSARNQRNKTKEPTAAGIGQTKLTELQEQKLLQEIEELNRIQEQKMHDLSIIEQQQQQQTKQKQANIHHNKQQQQHQPEQQSQPQHRRITKDAVVAAVAVVDPIKEREKRAFKAGAKDINSSRVQKEKAKKNSTSKVTAVEEEWKNSLQKDGINVQRIGHKVGIKGGNSNPTPSAENSPTPIVNIHQNLLDAAGGSSHHSGDELNANNANIAGINNFGYLQVYKKKQDVKQRGNNSNPRGGHRRNTSNNGGDDASSVNSNKDIKSEGGGRLFHNRRLPAEEKRINAQYEETTSLPAIPTTRYIKSSSNSSSVAGGGGYGGAGRGGQQQDEYMYHNQQVPLAGSNYSMYHSEYPPQQQQQQQYMYGQQQQVEVGYNGQYIHPLDGQNRRVLNTNSNSRNNTRSAPSRLLDRNDILPDISKANAYAGGYEQVVPVYNMQKNIPLNKGYSKR